ncbi:FAD-binding oxidoreductase [Breoghania sp. JC706]|uniref:FAD-binding oxidoreductase n=1 Tax=Breoghania sp. JC706 TaxID=3117732 RepID=UPI00300A3F5B
MTYYRPSKDIRSWGGVIRGEHEVAAPAWRDEVAPIIAEAIDRKFPILASGARRSYGDSGLNPGGALIDTVGLDRIVAFDPQTGIVRAEGGVTLDTLLRMFVPRGFFLPVTPGTRFVTLAGAIANDVHGKNHHLAGTFGCWVKRIGLVTSAGQELELSERDNPSLFRATIGGLGLTGVIAWAELKLEQIAGTLMDVEKTAFSNLEEFFELSTQSEVGWTYAVSWIDTIMAGRGVFLRANHAPASDRPPRSSERRYRVPVNFPGFLLNRHSIRLFNAVCYHKGRLRAGREVVPLARFFYPLDAVDNWNRMYGRRGMYQYQSVVPASAQADATREMLAAIADAGQSSFLAVLKTFGTKTSPGMLSFPMEGTTLALDFPNRGSETTRFLDRLDAIVREAKGRLYPAKDGRMSAEMFRLGYPDWQEFAKHVDPQFSSRFWRRVAG